MHVNADDLAVSNNEAAGRYEAHVDGQLALVAYHREGDRIIYIHTEVPEELEGQGIAGRMTHVALEDARAQRLSVVPQCPFVASYIERHPEYKDLVSPAVFIDDAQA